MKQKLHHLANMVNLNLLFALDTIGSIGKFEILKEENHIINRKVIVRMLVSM